MRRADQPAAATAADISECESDEEDPLASRYLVITYQNLQLHYDISIDL